MPTYTISNLYLYNNVTVHSNPYSSNTTLFLKNNISIYEVVVIFIMVMIFILIIM